MRRLASALLAAACPAAFAATPSVVWYGQVDNDVVFHTDRWYTSGVRLYRSQALDADSPIASAPAGEPWRERLDIGIVQEVYTPETKRSAAGDGDRPYAGRLQFSFARQMSAPGALDTLGVDAGVAGPASLVRQSQAFFHRFISSPETDWSRQLTNRVDLQAVASRSRQIATGMLPGALVLHGGAVLGTVTAFLHAGVEWRSSSQAPQSALLRFAATPPLGGEQSRGLSFFAGAGIRGVLRNRLLDRNSDDPRAGLGREKLVRRLAAGLSWPAPWGAITFGVAQDSAEFEGQRAPQRFGSLTLSLALD